MPPAPFANVFVLTGPTASGKTALGIELAERLNAEIVSMDSMALYRGMDIGTAKPTAAERRQTPHHLIDVRDPWETGSVAWWLDQAANCCREIEVRGRQVLFVGGTPLYVKALLYGIFQGPAADPVLRQRLETMANESGSAALHERLARVDPIAASRVHLNDRRRIIRALEVWELTGKPISAHQQEWRNRAETAADRVLCLDIPRAELYARIDARVEQMVAAGFIDEVRALRASPKPLSKEAAQAVGYAEMMRYLDGEGSLHETIQRIQTRTRQFAKRQLTWFRHLKPCQMVMPQLTWASWSQTIKS